MVLTENVMFLSNFVGKTLYSKIFQTLHCYYFAVGLCHHCGVDDLNFVSRSQVCQKYNCKWCVLDFCPLLLRSLSIVWLLYSLKGLYMI